jgi:hypothetical protein
MAGIGDVFGPVFSNAGGTLKSIGSAIFWGIMVLVIIGLVSWWGWNKYKNITFYRFPCSLTIIMENGMEKTRHDLKGGVFMNNGIRDFKIKVPKQRKPTILGYLPDFSLSKATDGRLHFITSGDRTIWQQYTENWITKDKVREGEHIFEYDLIKRPVPVEDKRIAVNAIKGWRDTVEKSKLTAFGIMIGGFIVMVIAHLISLYIQTRIKCGV